MLKRAWRRFREKWGDMTFGNKITVLLTIIAIFLSSYSVWLSKYSIHIDEDQNKWQNALDSDLATFESKSQATSEYQAQQQVSLQQTQVAIDAQVQALAIQQAFPLISIIIPPEPVLIVDQMVLEDISNDYVVTGSGSLDILIANNGGGRASFYEVEWLSDQPLDSNKASLNISELFIGDFSDPLPTAIEGQTPIRLRVVLEAKVSTTSNLVGKSDYELGVYWSDVIKSSDSHLDLKFSNADTVSVPVSKIKLGDSIPVPTPTPTISTSYNQHSEWENILTNWGILSGVLMGIALVALYEISKITFKYFKNKYDQRKK